MAVLNLIPSKRFTMCHGPLSHFFAYKYFVFSSASRDSFPGPRSLVLYLTQLSIGSRSCRNDDISKRTSFCATPLLQLTK